MVIYKIFVFGTDRKSNMAARAHNVFWLVEILKIFLLEKTIHKFSTGPPNDHSCKVTIQLA
jgi:hypothetical protein